MGQTVKIRILDHEYLIKTEEDEEQVHKIAEYVNERLTEIRDNTSGLSEQKRAILAALNIASDYFQLLKEQDDRLSSLQQRTERLIYHIDSVMS